LTSPSVAENPADALDRHDPRSRGRARAHVDHGPDPVGNRHRLGNGLVRGPVQAEHDRRPGAPEDLDGAADRLLLAREPSINRGDGQSGLARDRP